MIFQYPHPWYFRFLWLYIAWDILPYALDRVLAGEMGLVEVPDYIRYALAVEAGAVDVQVGDATADYIVIPEYDRPLVKAIVGGAIERDCEVEQ